MIERFKLSVSARHQLSALKRKTGMEHNNAICRHAFCLSLANPSVPPAEKLNTVGGTEMDFRVFSGGQDALYFNLLLLRLQTDGIKLTDENIREFFSLHVHRGLSYLASRREEDLDLELGRAMLVAWR